MLYNHLTKILSVNMNKDFLYNYDSAKIPSIYKAVHILT